MKGGNNVRNMARWGRSICMCVYVCVYCVCVSDCMYVWMCMDACMHTPHTGNLSTRQIPTWQWCIHTCIHTYYIHSENRPMPPTSNLTSDQRHPQMRRAWVTKTQTQTSKMIRIARRWSSAASTNEAGLSNKDSDLKKAGLSFKPHHRGDSDSDSDFYLTSTIG